MLCDVRDGLDCVKLGGNGKRGAGHAIAAVNAPSGSSMAWQVKVELQAQVLIVVAAHAGCHDLLSRGTWLMLKSFLRHLLHRMVDN